MAGREAVAKRVTVTGFSSASPRLREIKFQLDRARKAGGQAPNSEILDYMEFISGFVI